MSFCIYIAYGHLMFFAIYIDSAMNGDYRAEDSEVRLLGLI